MTNAINADPTGRVRRVHPSVASGGHVRLWGRLMVATAYVGTATTSIHANGIVRIIGNGYMAVTTDLYSLILAYAPNVMM